MSSWLVPHTTETKWVFFKDNWRNCHSNTTQLRKPLICQNYNKDTPTFRNITNQSWQTANALSLSGSRQQKVYWCHWTGSIILLYVCLFLQSLFGCLERTVVTLYMMCIQCCVYLRCTPHTLTKSTQPALCAGSDSPMTLPTRDYDGGCFLIHVK